MPATVIAKSFRPRIISGRLPRIILRNTNGAPPVWHAEKLKDPLLIYTNTSDDDVNVIEVESMIRALKAEGKKFEYKIFERAPGAHSFDRLDTYESSKIRLDIYKFMGRYLKPNKPFGSVKELRKAAYKF